MCRLTLVLCLSGLLSGIARADDGVDYVRDIKPIFARRCVSCHGSLKQKNGLRLDTSAFIRHGGASGPAIVPDKSGESLLIDHVTGANGAIRMPPEGDLLTEEQISLLKRWIDAGAKAPEEQPPPDPEKHWAFLPPVRPAVPQPEGASPGNPIDAFITAELTQRGLLPVGEAPRTVLLRRVYLDLIGLPPTRAQLDAFLNDTSADAYDKVVDQLLASPHYGERWGRHWMDVWRYSDWDGYAAEVRESQPHVWRWRDWIIESLNADKPYDRMVQEMLAGDELAPDDPQTVRATGFLVRNWYKFNRNVWLDNTVEHTGKAFLGITLNCARCHDHMYDPIPQQDYYRARAFFEPHEVRTDRVPGQPDTTKDGLVRVFDANAGVPTFLFHRGEDKQPDKEHPLTPGVPAILTRNGNAFPDPAAVPLPPASFYPGSRSFEQTESQAAAAAELAKSMELLKASQQALAATRQRAADFAEKGTANRPEPILVDDFTVAMPDVWTVGPGVWDYRDGRLVQSAHIDGWAHITTKPSMPGDFAAKFRFRTTGGKQWKSVGLSFDRLDEDHSTSVYLSAYAGGPKLQVSHRTKGQDSYPANASKAVPVELNREYELDVIVRGRKLNVGLDGKLLLVYMLPDRPGSDATRKISLWTYDATAEFLDVRISPLDPGLRLADAEGQPLPADPTAESLARAIAQAEADVHRAEMAFATAKAAAETVEAKIAADRARYASPPAADAESLAQAAGKAERELAFRQTEQKLLEAEEKLSAAKLVMPETDQSKKAVADAETALAATRKARDDARAALSQPAATYTRLGTVYPETSTGRRLALARWITARSNPLPARVAINHIWLRHFGQPLVSSVFDFGLSGKKPTHPALLDWLAVEFMDSGWKMKAVHRLIVTSQAYRRHSAAPADLLAKNRAADPENVFLWKMNARRLEAEAVRDCTLAAAGSLDPTPYGPDLDHATGLSVPRRSIYFRSAKEKKMTFLALFDSPNVVECYRRAESIVPQQALAMANSPLSRSQSRVLAAKLTTEVGAASEFDRRFVETAYVQVLGRDPTADEADECLQFLSDQTQRFTEKAALTPFSSGDAATVKPSADPHQRARENLVHVLLNHNDFLTMR